MLIFKTMEGAEFQLQEPAAEFLHKEVDSFLREYCFGFPELRSAITFIVHRREIVPERKPASSL